MNTFVIDSMTQRHAALEAVKALKADPLNVELVSDLERVVGEAQNRPPQGLSDGSIPAEMWTHLRDLVRRLHAVRMGFKVIDMKWES